jgi:formate dehydrogenase iron-sulfur subunit
LLAKAKARVEELKESKPNSRTFPNAAVYGEKEMGGLHVISVLPFGVEAHRMPVNPKTKLTTTLEQLLKPLTGVGILAVLGVSVASFIGGRSFLAPDGASKEGGDA